MTVTSPRTADHRDFAALTDPLRPELTAHCYRMLGSVHDAEDQVQETYLRAWRAFHAFEGRSSVRTWMYQIATRTCLTALDQRSRRPLPTGLGAPSSDPQGPLESRPDVPWLEPLPDALVTAPGADPANVAAARDGIRLAFVAALQHLPPRQRAVLILRDVLAYSAAEAATVLGVSVASANSALQRARATVSRLSPSAAATSAVPLRARERDLLARYMAAFEEYDVARVVSLLTEDATWEMPPFTGWYAGAQAIGALIRTQCPAKGLGDMRFVATGANGQPACAAYLLDDDGTYQAFQIHVLDIEVDGESGGESDSGGDGERDSGGGSDSGGESDRGGGSGGSGGGCDVAAGRVRHVTCFFDLELFAAFGLPLQLTGRA